MTVRSTTLRAAAAAAMVTALCPGRAASAAQTDVMVSMDPPPAAPKIHAPAVIGAAAGAPFLYAVPATGAAPLTFAAKGLPAGLSLATDTGIITGMTPGAGSYPFTVTVNNASGAATATITLTSGSTIALTPPLGWNSYDSYGDTVTESELLANAKAMRKALTPFGYDTVAVDYGWYNNEDVIDANGRWMPSPSKWQSSSGGVGFKSVADQVHALGLKFGVHIMRGIPRKSASAKSPIAGSSYTADQAANTSDACPWESRHWGVHNTPAGQAWYDSLFAQFAAWGLDFVKVDDSLRKGYGEPEYPAIASNYHKDEVVMMATAIAKSGRAIVLSLSGGPSATENAASYNASANMWRISDDFWDLSSWNKNTSLYPWSFTEAGIWQGATGLTPGHWPDLDMLAIGYLGPRCTIQGNRNTAFSHNEQVAIMSLWSILPSPLIFGGNVTDLATGTTGPWTTAMLTNDEVLAVDQDPLGARGKLIGPQGMTEIWARDLSGGRKAVAFFNHQSADAMVSVSFAQLGLTGPITVRDLWRRADVTGMSTSLSASVPYNGALMYVLSPPGGAPDGGADGGAPPDAGSGGAMGSGGGGGVTGAAGAGMQSGGAGGSASTTGAGGASTPAGGHSGTGGSGGRQLREGSGCGCRVPDARETGSLSVSAALLALGLAASRRRKA